MADRGQGDGREAQVGKATASAAPAHAPAAAATPGKATQAELAAGVPPTAKTGAADTPTGKPGGQTQPIPDKQRAMFEKSLKRDLGPVVIHTGPEADALAKQHDARAFAIGPDIYFADGEFDPSNPDKERLLAHEVAHTVQQAGAALTEKVPTTEPGDAAEKNADAAASKMMAGAEAKVEQEATQSIAREKPGEKKNDKKKEQQPLAKAILFSGISFKGAGQKPNAKWRQDLKDDNVPDDAGPSQGREKVSINAPGVTINAHANGNTKLEEEEFGPHPVEVGFIQNVTGLSRHGVYMKDGKKVAEYTQDATKALHDHMTVGDNPRLDVRNWAGKPPWYGPPAVIGNRNEAKDISMYDRPGFDLPMKYGGGYLAQIKGADRFTTTVATKRGEELHKAESREWAIPWDMQINTGAGKGQQLGEGKGLEDAKKTDKHVTELAGQTAWDLKEGIILESIEAAMATDFHWLLMQLPTARAARDANLSEAHKKTYGFMIQALKAKDPTYELTLDGEEFGAAYDNYKITVACGARSTVLKGRTAWFGKGAKTSFLASTIIDYDSYDGSDIKAKVQIDDKKQSDEIQIMMPAKNLDVKIGGSTQFTNGYTLSVDVKSKGG